MEGMGKLFSVKVVEQIFCHLHDNIMKDNPGIASIAG